MNRPGNALIVVNYNDKETTGRFIEKIKENRFIDHIIIVDNYSTDNSFDELIRLKDDRIDVIQAGSNGGYAKGNNFGAWYAINQYDLNYLLFSNPDVEFDEEAVREMERVLMSTASAGAVACKTIGPSRGKNPVAWKLPRFSDCIKENLIVTKKLMGDRTRYEESYINSSPLVCVDVVPGSFFGISCAAFRDIGGFDESTFLYGEENLMAYKLKKKGYQSYLISDREYYHDHSTSIDKSITSLYKKLRIGLDGRLVYADKVLKVNPVKRWILYLTFYLGAFDYIILRKLLQIVGIGPVEPDDNELNEEKNASV